MLNINEEIKQLFQLIETPLTYRGKNIFNRLQAWAILSLFNDINYNLECINDKLDKSLDYDALGIDFDTFINGAHSLKKNLPTIAKNSSIISRTPQTYQSPINRMTDYLPNGVPGYDITSDVVGSFRTAMHQLCDEDRISPRAIEKALNIGLDTLCMLLTEIQEKIEKPKPYLYLNLWNDLEYTYFNTFIEEEYRKWVAEIGDPSLDELRDKLNQAIFELLTSGFFRFCPQPTRGAVTNRKLKIGENELAVGTAIPVDFDVECTKFEKFIEWKGNCILALNYEKLGQYIYRNYRKFNEGELYNIIYFDTIKELINENLAIIKPELAKYTKRYQEDKDKELLNDCRKIFIPFKEHLKNDISKNVIDVYLEKLLLDSDYKEDAKARLSGQSRKKYCCSILFALCSCYIFPPEFASNKTELAKTLNKGLDGDNKETLIRYLKDSNNNDKKLTSWTKEIMDTIMWAQFTMTKTG